MPPSVRGTAPSEALTLGTAGEHLVCADLLLQGYRAFLTSQMCPYDVAVDVGRGRLVRVQVKTTREPRAPICGGRSREHFFYRWGARAGKNKIERARRIHLDEFDYLAFVALDVRQIAYVPASAQSARTIFTIKSHPLKKGDRSFADYPFVPR